VGARREATACALDATRTRRHLVSLTGERAKAEPRALVACTTLTRRARSRGSGGAPTAPRERLEKVKRQPPSAPSSSLTSRAPGLSSSRTQGEEATEEGCRAKAKERKPIESQSDSSKSREREREKEQSALSCRAVRPVNPSVVTVTACWRRAYKGEGTSEREREKEGLVKTRRDSAAQLRHTHRRGLVKEERRHRRRRRDEGEPFWSSEVGRVEDDAHEAARERAGDGHSENLQREEHVSSYYSKRSGEGVKRWRRRRASPRGRGRGRMGGRGRERDAPIRGRSSRWRAS